MVNIPTDEETRPLAQSSVRVVEAYATNDRHNKLRNIAMLILAFLLFIFLSSDTTSKSNTKSTKIAKNLRNTAETMPEVEVKKIQNIVNKLDSNNLYAGLKQPVPLKEVKEDPYLVKTAIQNQDDLEREVEKMFSFIEMAEEDDIDTNNSMLTSAVKTMDDSIKFYLGRVFGYGEDLDDDDDDDDLVRDDAYDIKLTEGQLDAIAKKISERLEREAKLELKMKADAVKEEKVKEVKQVLAEDKMNARAMANDVHEVENVVLEDLKDEIDEVAARVKDSLPEKVKNLRNEVVLEVTGKKLDDIEKNKQAKKEKKQEIVKKFEEIQQKIVMGQVDVPVTKGKASVEMNALVGKEESSVGKKAQFATEETSVGMISKVARDETSVGKIDKVAKEETPVEKNSLVAKKETRSIEEYDQVAKEETLAGKNSQIATEEMPSIRKNAQVSKAVAELDVPVTKVEAPVVGTNAQVAKVKTPSGGTKNVKTLSVMDNDESDVTNVARANMVVKKTEKAPKTTTRIDRDDSSMKIVLRSDEQSEDTETTSTTSTSFAPDYESALRVGGDEEADDDDDD